MEERSARSRLYARKPKAKAAYSPSRGWVGTPTYRSWAMMLSRCRDPKSPDYESYGAKGIIVCKRWWSFGNFLADMGPRPPGTSIDRYPNKYGDYEPSNCRWATAKEQANNKRPWGTVAAKKFPKKIFA